MTNEEAIKKLERHKAEYLDKWVDFSGFIEALDMAIRALKNEQTADVKPIVYGEWEYYKMGDFKCTNCGFIKYDATEFNFCPSCGAYMRKESEEEEKEKKYYCGKANDEYCHLYNGGTVQDKCFKENCLCICEEEE